MLNKILASSGTLNNNLLTFDYDSFVHRLLLFDEYIMDSMQLNEIPYIVNLIGIEGFKTLLETNQLKLLIEQSAIGHISKIEDKFVNNFTGDIIQIPRTLDTHDFKTIRTGQEHISKALQKIHNIKAIGFKEQKKIKNLIVDKMVHYPLEHGLETLEYFDRQYTSKITTIKYALSNIINKELQLLIAPKSIELEIKTKVKGSYIIHSNLEKDFRINKSTAFNLIGKAIVANMNIHKKINEMEIFNAYSGFKNDEIDLFDYELKFFYQKIANNHLEFNMNRFIKITNFPTLTKNPNIKININNLLKIKEDKDIIEFRKWLSELHKSDDKEIEEQIKTYKYKLTNIVGNTSGKTLRLLLGFGIGALNPPAGIAFNAIDTFLMDKFFKRQGYISFIHNTFPTIYQT